jgi:hypothetical protein
MYTLCYFVGLVVLAIATATLNKVPEYGFFIIGCGLVLYPVFTLGIHPIIRKLTRIED